MAAFKTLLSPRVPKIDFFPALAIPPDTDIGDLAKNIKNRQKVHSCQL